MFHKSYGDITELSYGLTKKLVYSPYDEVDLVTSADTQIHNVMVESASCKYDFDLKSVWLTQSRWNSLVRQYVNPAALDAFLQIVEDKLVGRKRGLAMMRTQMVAKRVNESTGREWRTWGSCMLGISYRALPKPQITLHSRTTYLGYIGQLDLALAHVIAREVAERVGLKVEDIAFAWHLEAGQFHGFKSLAWFFQTDDDQANLEKERKNMDKLKLRAPTLYLAYKQFAAFKKFDEEGVLYGDMSFAQQTRVRRRWHTEVLGKKYSQQFGGGTRRPGSMAKPAAPLPHIPVEKLTLKPLDSLRKAALEMGDAFDLSAFLADDEDAMMKEEALA